MRGQSTDEVRHTACGRLCRLLRNLAEGPRRLLRQTLASVEVDVLDLAAKYTEKGGHIWLTIERLTKSETRERLIQSTLDLLHSGGEAAITTISVTRGAGIVQSAFYQHFVNVDECLAVAAERVTSRIREVVATARHKMFETGPGAGEDLERSYQGMFRLVSHHRPIMQLFLRYRCDPLALNGVMHRFGRGLSNDLAGQLAHQALKVGLSAPPRDWIEALADQLVAASLAAIEAHLDRRGPSVIESARLLAALSTGACVAVFEALQIRSQSHPTRVLRQRS